MAAANISIPDNQTAKLMFRPFASFEPSIWADQFSSILPIQDKNIETWSEEVEELKVEVSFMLTNRITEVESKLAFIDILERLGISHLFNNDIEEELEKIFASSLPIRSNDLSVVALYFRLLRQHGFHISCKVFDDFKDEDGFKKQLLTDVKGLLNLYEAAHTRIHGEDILEEALTFTSTHLELMLPQMPPSLAKHVSHALEQSLHRGIPRVEACFFISLFEQEHEEEEESNNYNRAMVLRLAKLDFSLLQILHRKELAQVSSWWKDLISEFPYARDRIVEGHYWAIGVYPESQYSLARVMLTKTIAMVSILDDTYDAYGTLDELKLFTQAVQSWDISEIDRLPEYMKVLYKALLHLYVSYEEELRKFGRSYAVSYSKERMKEIVQSYYIEAKWIIDGYIPSFEEYLQNGLITSTYFLLTTTSLLGMESAKKEEFEWMKSNPKILMACTIICRVVDDMATYETEKKRDQITTGIDCYIKQYGVTMEVAMNDLNKIVENAWKDMSESGLRPFASSEDILKRLHNFARLVEVTYKHNEDGYTNPRKVLKPHILALLANTL